jgi:hypothetical protein
MKLGWKCLALYDVINEQPLNKSNKVTNAAFKKFKFALHNNQTLFFGSFYWRGGWVKSRWGGERHILLFLLV